MTPIFGSRNRPECAAELAKGIGVRRHVAGLGDDEGARYVGIGEQLTRGREGARSVQNHAQRLRLPRRQLDVPNGQGRIVRSRCTGSHQHSVHLGAPSVDELARLRAAHPLAVAGGGRDLSIERGGHLEGDERAPGRLASAARTPTVTSTPR